MSTPPLPERVVVVTGAAQGIGEAIARAAVAAGAHVALCDRNGDALAALAAGLAPPGDRAGVLTGTLDVRDEVAVTAFIDGVADHHGRIDVLVNNAGGGFAADFLGVSAKGQDALIRENFTSVAACIRAAVTHMPPVDDRTERGGGGSIINITSIEAHRAGPGFAIYSAMKAAVENLTKSLALELGARRIRVNCVAPDVIPTPGIGHEMPVTTPLPYAGTVEDVAAVVVFLASDAAAFITGTTVHVDGGNHAAGGWFRATDGSFTTH